MTMFLAKAFLNLEEVALVAGLQDQFPDVVGLVGIVRDQPVERHVVGVGRLAAGDFRNFGRVGGRQQVDEAAHLQQRLDIVVVGAIGDRRFRRVDGGAAELFCRHRLVGYGLHHVRPGDEHVGGVAHHEDEVGHRRRIDVAAGAGTHDDGNLRNDARGQHVALEHLGIAAECGHALLDAGAAGIVDADDGRAVPQRHVLHLLDLFGMRLRQRAAEHREILGEQKDRAAVDGAPAGDDAVAGDLLLLHAEIGGAMLDEHVELLERAFIEKNLDTLARGQLAALVLRVDAGLAAAHAGILAPPLEFAAARLS